MNIKRNQYYRPPHKCFAFLLTRTYIKNEVPNKYIRFTSQNFNDKVFHCIKDDLYNLYSISITNNRLKINNTACSKAII